METCTVYEAPPLTLVRRVVATLTLFAIFALCLTYVIVVPLLIYFAFVRQIAWVVLVSISVASSVYWASGKWPYFMESRVFDAWRSYFQLRICKEVSSYRGKNNVMIAFLPHGLLPLSMVMLAGIYKQVLPEFEGVTYHAAVANNLFNTPIVSPMLTWLGCVPAEPDPIQHALNQGICCLCPDGIAGAYHSNRDSERLYLKNRKGFIRIALQNGSTIIPVYSFGHTQLFDVYPSKESWLSAVSRRLRFSIIFFWGHTFCPPVPRSEAITVVMGEPIVLEKIANPSVTQVDDAHALFVRSMTALYNKHRLILGGSWKHKELEIC